MPQDEDTGKELVRKHIWFSEEDWTRIGDFFAGPNGVGHSRAIRLIVRNYLSQLEAKAAAQAQRPAVDMAGLDQALKEGEAQ